MSEQSWIEVSSGFCRDNTVSDSNFPSTVPVTNRFSSLSVEYASLDPEDTDPHGVIECSHIQFTSASSHGAVTPEKVGPIDLELLDEAIAAVAEHSYGRIQYKKMTDCFIRVFENLSVI